MNTMKLSGVHFESGYLTHDDHAEDAITDWYKSYRSDEYAFPVVYINRSYKAVVEWHKTQEAADARKIQIAGFGMWIEEYPTREA